jgi:hypothetical protein
VFGAPQWEEGIGNHAGNCLGQEPLRNSCLSLQAQGQTGQARWLVTLCEAVQAGSALPHQQDKKERHHFCP